MKRPTRHVVLVVLAALALAGLTFMSSVRRRASSVNWFRASGGSEQVGICKRSSNPEDDEEHVAEKPGGEGPHHIKYVALIAERHSGSRWMEGVLAKYFRGKNIKVTPTLCTWKHWFQDRIHEDIQDGNRPCRETDGCPACKDVEHTLVVALWRNPYDWTSGMQQLPHHSSAHVGIEDYTAFVTKPWTLEPKDEDIARGDALLKAKHNVPCIGNFMPWEVLPCKENDKSAIYELDFNGQSYCNLYELRKAKIRDFNAVRSWAPYYEKILYEDLIEGDGLRDWLNSLEKTYGLSGNDTIPTPDMAREMAKKRNEMYYTNSQNCTPHCMMGGVAGERPVETMHELWDEELEADIGYHQVQQP